MKRTKLKKGSAVEVGSYVKVTRPSGAEFEGIVESLTDTAIKLDSGRRFRVANVTIEPIASGTSTRKTSQKKTSTRGKAAGGTRRKTTTRGTRAASGEAKGTNGRRRTARKAKTAPATNGANPFEQEMNDLTWYSQVYTELEGSLEHLRNRDLKAVKQTLNGVLKALG